MTSLGIDVEAVVQTAESHSALAYCFTPDELEILAATADGPILGFAAKEALFKAINPLTHVFFDFLDAKIVGIDNSSMHLELLVDVGPGHLRGSNYKACWRHFEGHVLVAVRLFA
ncbi:4'-phosphopantetheinyl transferase superfamily protein [Pelomonas nitida]|uniref:Enterobactin synthase component D n=1 Tax=Pelomonas nitida TaxID=3299027 RepID=A0ABW7GCV4_9BURK